MTAGLRRRVGRLRAAAGGWIPEAGAAGPPVDPTRLTPAEREELAGLRAKIDAARGLTTLTDDELDRLEAIREKLMGGKDGPS